MKGRKGESMEGQEGDNKKSEQEREKEQIDNCFNSAVLFFLCPKHK